LNFAFNAKKPIIATRVGGFKEILIDQVNGFLIPRKDPHKLATAILDLIENKDLAIKIAQNGNEYYKRIASWNVILKKMLIAISLL